MRLCALLVLVVLAAGCGRKQTPAKEYWDEEARLQMFQAAVQMLRENVRSPSSFVAQQDGDSAPQRSDFVAALSFTIGTAETFSQSHGGSENTVTVREVLREAREIQALDPKGPNPQLTTTVNAMADRAAKLTMRPMTKAEEASIQKSIK